MSYISRGDDDGFYSLSLFKRVLIDHFPATDPASKRNDMHSSN